MVTGCVIRKCSSVWNPLSNTSYHCFPMKNAVLLEKWTKAIPPGLIGIPTKNSRICSLHFEKELFMESLTGKRTLHKDAIPSLFGSEARSEKTSKIEKEEVEKKESDVDLANISETEKDDSDQEYDRKIYYANTKGIYKRRTKAVGIQTVLRHSKITPKEIYLKRQIVLLKRRLNRRESRIKSMTELVRALEKIIMRKNKGIE